MGGGQLFAGIERVLRAQVRIELERGNVQILEIDGIYLLDLVELQVAAMPSPLGVAL